MESAEQDTEPAPLAPVKKRRNRKPITCAQVRPCWSCTSGLSSSQCRRRKLKCDKNDPCGACSLRGEQDECDWSDAAKPVAASGSTSAEIDALKSKLDRLEERLVGPSSQPHASPDAAPSPSPFAALSLSAPVVTLPDSTDPYNCLPRQWNQIVALFLQDTVFSAPISRIASLWERVGQLHAQIAMPAPRGYQDSINVALVLAMCAATVMECPLLAAEPCLAGLLETDAIAWSTQSSAALLESRKMQVEMMCGPPLINQTIDEIRTLYLLHRFRRFRHPMLASMDLASAIALAREVGIHLEDNADGIDAEQSRQLWALLLAADALHTPVASYTVNLSQSSARPPSQAIEDLFRANRPLQRPDSRTRLALQLKLAEISHQMTDKLYCPSALAHLGLVEDVHQKLMALDTQFEDLIDIHPEPHRGYVLPLPKDASVLELQECLANCDAKMAMMQLHRPFLLRGLCDRRLAAHRHACIVSARFILIMFRAALGSDRAKKSAELAYFALNALIVLVLNRLVESDSTEAAIAEESIEMAIQALRAMDHQPQYCQLTLDVLQALMAFKDKTAFANSQDRAHLESLGWTALRKAEYPRAMVWSYDTALNKAIPEVKDDPAFLATITFGKSLPVSLLQQGSSTLYSEHYLSNAWSGFRHYNALLPMLPDANEWQELLHSLTGSQSWVTGIEM